MQNVSNEDNLHEIEILYLGKNENNIFFFFFTFFFFIQYLKRVHN